MALLHGGHIGGRFSFFEEVMRSFQRCAALEEGSAFAKYLQGIKGCNLVGDGLVSNFCFPTCECVFYIREHTVAKTGITAPRRDNIS